ncbi:hypothetical protein AB691_1932 [Stutzerimonas stutzeri]|nr:hypothetical protein AB691_1932 [Stutzerimonas stutzeri]
MDATVIAIRSAHEELKRRFYEIGLYRSGLIGQGDEDGGFEDDDFENERGEEPAC